MKGILITNCVTHLRQCLINDYQFFNTFIRWSFWDVYKEGKGINNDINKKDVSSWQVIWKMKNLSVLFGQNVFGETQNRTSSASTIVIRFCATFSLVSEAKNSSKDLRMWKTLKKSLYNFTLNGNTSFRSVSTKGKFAGIVKETILKEIKLPSIFNFCLDEDNFIFDAFWIHGALDTVTNELVQGLEDLEIRGRVNTIQTLLRLARILRRVLETRGDLLSLILQWKTIT